VSHDILRLESFRGHDSSADLAEAHPVAPARAMQRELRGDTVCAPFGPNDEGTAVKVRVAEPPPNLQFLPHDDGPPRPDNPEPHNAPRWTTLQRLEQADLAKVHARPLVQQRSEFFLRIGHGPAVEIRCLLVERRKHLPEDVPIGRVAVGFRRGMDPLRSGLFGID